ncbi:MAG: zinc-ribbon domain-containing protein [Clostridia bacterium]|nr:zinc-ribbon domain-containing protein [Clostridia bacterium]
MKHNCPRCGTVLEAGAVYCSNCGGQIAPHPGEERTVTPAQKSNPGQEGYETPDLPLAATLTKATFGVRLLAYIVDVIILTAIQMLFAAISPDVALVTNVIVTAAYFTIMVGRDGQTFGKKFMGIKIITADGNVPSYGKAFIRHIGQIISALILGLGYLLILFDKQSQALHDKIAGTYVVKAPRTF